MKKKRFRAGKILLLLGLVILACAWSAFGPMVKGALSVKELDKGLYYMEFKGDDGFDGFVESGGACSPQKMGSDIFRFLSRGFAKGPETGEAAGAYGCAAFTVRDAEDHFMMGRNFDFSESTAMILHSRPKNGYESIATFNLRFLGFGEDWKPDSFANKYMALSCLFVSLDGMNEKGLAIADLMAGDDTETHQDRGLPDMTTTSALRYVLNRAATVDEAIRILNSIDMHSDIGTAHHYAISDASGRSVVAEYIDGELVVTDTPIVTNHYLAPVWFGKGQIPGDNRYDILEDEYVEYLGIFDNDSLKESMASVSQTPSGSFGGTQWTVLWDLDRLTATYYLRRNFDKAYEFKLGKK